MEFYYGDLFPHHKIRSLNMGNIHNVTGHPDFIFITVPTRRPSGHCPHMIILLLGMDGQRTGAGWLAVKGILYWLNKVDGGGYFIKGESVHQ